MHSKRWKFKEVGTTAAPPMLGWHEGKHKISGSFGQKMKAAEKLPLVFTASFTSINRDATETSDGF